MKTKTKIRPTIYLKALEELEDSVFSCHAINIASGRGIITLNVPETNAYVALFGLPINDYRRARQLEYILESKYKNTISGHTRALADSMRIFMLTFAYYYFKDGNTV